MRGKPYQELSHEVERLFRPVERFKPVDFPEKIVDELRHPDQPLAAVFRDQDVLVAKFQHLVVRDEFPAVGVVDVAEFPKPLDRDADLVGPEMSQRKIDHIVTDSPVFEDIKVLQRPENPFFDWFHRPFAGYQPFHAL